MTTLAKNKIQSLQLCGHLLWEYSFYIRRELRNPIIYLTAALIGVFFIRMMNAPSIIAFLIPFIVQTAVQAMLRFKSRDVDTLLLLPGHRENRAVVQETFDYEHYRSYRK